MTQQQPVQQPVVFEMAKTPAQIAEEARVAALTAQQDRFADLIAKCEVSEEAGQYKRENNDYTRVITIDDDTWLFTWEGTSMRVIGQSGQPDGRVINIPCRYIREGENGERYVDDHVGINLTKLFAGKRSDISTLVMLAGNRDDSDVNRMMEKILGYGDFQVDWPTGDTSVNLIDMYILLAKVKRDNRLVRTSEGRIGQILQVKWNQANPFVPEHVSYVLRSTVALGKSVAIAKQQDAHWDSKTFESNLPLTIATPEQLADAVELGRKNMALMSGSNAEGFNHVMFNGTAYTPDWRGRPIPHVVKARVVIDAEGLRLLEQHRLSGLYSMVGLGVDLDRKVDAKTVAPSDNDLAMLAPVAVFFNLDRCDWQLGELKDVQEISFRRSAFDQLVLDSQRKRLVEALVVHTSSGNGKNVDLIDGKGGGAIFLLDGPPGTGKTLTAEATSEKLERPLYKVGLGELGTHAEQLEGSLNQVLNIARRWNAVLLLDEADVFLEKRSTENLERNAMVAVFLRLLEYYDGIMFLTTNRGDNFDPAVLSRVTLALHFRRPTEEGRATIWTNLLKNAGVTVSEKEAKALASMDINGREIKNAINSSVSLAAADGTAVTYEHIREIVDASVVFTEEVKREVPEEGNNEGMIRKLAAALLKLIK